MTKFEFMTKVANGEMNDEMVEYAKATLEKMEQERENRKSHKSKKDQEKAAANEAMARDIVNEILTTEAKTATDIAEMLNVDRAEDAKLSVQKVSHLCRKACEMQLATQIEVKIPGKGRQKGYVVFDEFVETDVVATDAE